MKVKQWVFVGVEDEQNCDDCRKALSGNPHKQHTAPIPGQLQCGSECRHAVQIQEQDVTFIEWLKWHLF